MTATTLGHHSAARSRADWFAVSVAPPRRIDPWDSFTTVATRMAAPITADTRPQVTVVLAELAEAADVGHLVPTAADPDAALHRLAGRILARYVQRPDHPAIIRAAAHMRSIGPSDA